MYLKGFICVGSVVLTTLPNKRLNMTGVKQGTHYRPGIPASEEELREWKKSFTDIQESIDNLMEEEDVDCGRDSRQIRKTDCKKGNA
jgi:hypothetical protein